MKGVLFIAASAAAALFVTGCASSRDPDIAGRPIAWYQTTDPHSFFVREQSRGTVYFIGLYDPALGIHSPVPGVPQNDPLVSPYQTWMVPSHFIADPTKNRQFLQAAEQFARRYNPEVLAYLKQRPH